MAILLCLRYTIYLFVHLYFASAHLHGLRACISTTFTAATATTIPFVDSFIASIITMLLVCTFKVLQQSTFALTTQYSIM